MNYLKPIAIFLLALVIVNLLLFALGKITPLLFWFVIAGTALIAFYIIPNIKKQEILEQK